MDILEVLLGMKMETYADRWIFKQASDEIIRLRERLEWAECLNNDWKEQCWEMLDEIQRLRERVKELEHGKIQDYVYVHKKQIDVAWEYAWEHREDDPTAIETLKEIGIVRCEKCGGTGHIQEQNEEGTYLYATGGMPIIIDCPICNEHGWVMKDESGAGRCGQRDDQPHTVRSRDA